MMTMTDLASAVLEEIGALPAGDVPTSADAKTIKTHYKRWHRLAVLRDIVNWYDEDELIPDGAEEAVTFIMADRVCGLFGIPRDPNWKVVGYASLEDFVRDKIPPEPTQIVSF